MLEKDLENKIKKYLEKKEFYYVKVHGNTFGKVGIPDILACIYGKFVGIEIKNPNGKGVVSKLQQHNLEKIKNSGGYSFVVDDYDNFIKEMEFIKSVIPKTTRNI